MRKCVNCREIYNDPEQLFCPKDGGRITDSEQTPPTVNYQNFQNQSSFPPPVPPAPAKKSTNTLLILGGVGALMLMLFIGTILAFTLMSRSKTNTGNSTAVNLKPTPVKSADIENSPEAVNAENTSEGENPSSTREQYEAEIKTTINSANDAQTAAYSTYNTNPIRNYYTGAALKTFLNDINYLKKNNIYQIGELKEQTFESIKINEAGDKAEVKMVESWKTTVYQKTTDKCIRYYEPVPSPQTVKLIKASRGWMVESVTYEPSADSPEKPCHVK